MTQGSGQPILIAADRVHALEPVPLDSGPSESWLQELLDEHPNVLPVDKISAAWGPLISVGREIEIPVGYIDNMFVSPTGEVTVVEAKLWDASRFGCRPRSKSGSNAPLRWRDSRRPSSW